MPAARRISDRLLLGRLAATALSIATVLNLGCAQEETPVAVVAPEAPALTVASLVPEQPAPDAVEPSPVAPTATVAASDAELVSDYHPPFPNRVDLFVPPKRQGGVPTEGAQQNSVQLIGFVRVDRQRAVLSIDGNVASIPEGETQFGVEVISIKQPKVELQRGRQRWHATLE